MKLEAQLDGNISLGVSSIGIGAATAGDIRGFIYHSEKRCRTAAILHFFLKESEILLHSIGYWELLLPIDIYIYICTFNE